MIDVVAEQMLMPHKNEYKCRSCRRIFPKTVMPRDRRGRIMGRCEPCLHEFHATNIASAIAKRKQGVGNHKQRRSKKNKLVGAEVPCEFCGTTNPFSPRTWYASIDVFCCVACKAKLDDACRTFKGHGQ